MLRFSTDQTNLEINQTVRPLAETSISKAELLKEQAHTLIQEAIEQELNISEFQALMEKADELLVDAKEQYSSGNYIAANTLALEAIDLYQQAIEILESLLG